MMRVEVVDGATTRALRRAVLRPALDPSAPLPGDGLDTAVHIGAVVDAEVVGTCFVYPNPCLWFPDVVGAWRLRQMATAVGHRGRGVGAAVLAAAVDLVRDADAALLWCNARESAGGFYARCGFQVHGEVFTDECHPIAHLRMWRELRARPTAS